MLAPDIAFSAPSFLLQATWHVPEKDRRRDRRTEPWLRRSVQGYRRACGGAGWCRVRKPWRQYRDRRQNQGEHGGRRQESFQSAEAGAGKSAEGRGRGRDGPGRPPEMRGPSRRRREEVAIGQFAS